MNKDELLGLRERIISKTRQLALDGVDEPASRLEILMGLIRSGDTSREMMDQAVEIAEQLPKEDRLDAYLDLVYEIDAQLSDTETPEVPQTE